MGTLRGVSGARRIEHGHVHEENAHDISLE